MSLLFGNNGGIEPFSSLFFKEMSAFFRVNCNPIALGRPTIDYKNHINNFCAKNTAKRGVFLNYYSALIYCAKSTNFEE